MATPVVLITGALTGIGRATAVAFTHEGARIVVSGRRDEAGNALATELRAPSAPKLNTCVPTCAARMTFVTSSTKPSGTSVAWTWPSMTPEPKAGPAR